MPNFDTGHYFLTTLAPIKEGTTFDTHGVRVSYEQNIRITLATLPTAQQSPATENSHQQSPFAANLRTHLCRYMVLDDVVYNGRIGEDALLSKIKDKFGGDSSNPLLPEPVDQLNTSYLMFTADIDAVTKDGELTEEGASLPKKLTIDQQDAVRDAYAHQLWETMEDEIRAIYSNCVGFDEVNDGAAFADYLKRCQVETTMPFNDYWLDKPEFSHFPIKRLLALVLIPMLVTFLALLGWLLHIDHIPLLHWFVDWTPGWTLLGGFAVTGLSLWGVYRYILNRGNKPLPPGKYADLPSVLKSLYTQQHFTDFVIDNQGKSDAELHQAFGEFLKQHKPSDKFGPTQKPGVISSTSSPNAVTRKEA